MKTAKDLVIPFSWEKRKPFLSGQFLYLPAYYNHTKTSFPFFSEKKEIAIEYCSGNGAWILEKAKKKANINWIAVEKKFERARQIWRKLHGKNLSNVVVVCGEALCFTRYYAPKAQTAYINFPDPWPKRRHAKHRLINKEFLQELSKIIFSEGKVFCATDDFCYHEWMKEVFASSTFWEFLFYLNEFPEYGDSFFKDLWLQKGKTIHYLSYKRRP